jgi:predicted Zn-dependent peptidase
MRIRGYSIGVILLLTLLLTTMPPPLHAQGADELNIVTYTLDNGLAVILVEDDSAPTVAVDLWYDVGSANDPANRGGFAHLFEHLLFQGSANVAPGDHFRLSAAAGGDANATSRCRGCPGGDPALYLPG